MRILFDQGTPAPLRRALAGHEIATAFERGWGTFQNGELLRAAEAAGFEAIIITDQNLRYQQNLDERRLAILVLLTTDWRLIRQHSNLSPPAPGARPLGAPIGRICLEGDLRRAQRSRPTRPRLFRRTLSQRCSRS